MREGEASAQLQLGPACASAGSKTALAQVGRVEGLSVRWYPTIRRLCPELGVHSLITGRLYPRTEHKTSSGEDGGSGGRGPEFCIGIWIESYGA